MAMNIRRVLLGVAVAAGLLLGLRHAEAMNMVPCPGANSVGIGTIGSTGVTVVLPADTQRTYFILLNFTSHVDYWGFNGAVTTTTGIPMAANGGGYEWGVQNGFEGNPVSVGGTVGDTYYCMYSDG